MHYLERPEVYELGNNVLIIGAGNFYGLLVVDKLRTLYFGVFFFLVAGAVFIASAQNFDVARAAAESRSGGMYF